MRPYGVLCRYCMERSGPGFDLGPNFRMMISRIAKGSRSLCLVCHYPTARIVSQAWRAPWLVGLGPNV